MKFSYHASRAFTINRAHYSARVVKLVRMFDHPELSRRLSLEAQGFVTEGMDKDEAICAAFTLHVQENNYAH